MKKSILKGASIGLLTWLIYGIVEFVLAVAIPQLWWRRDVQLLPWQLPLIGWLFVAYALAGLLSGAVGGAWLTWRGKGHLDTLHSASVSLILTLAFIFNLLAAWPLARSEEIALVVAVGLAVIFCCALGSSEWLSRVAFLTNPWPLCLLLLAAPWVSRDAMPGSAVWVKTGVSLAAIGAVAGIAAGLRWIWPGKLAVTGWTAVSGVALAGALWAGVYGLGRASAVQAAGSEASAASPSVKPNILLITMDTVRADHVSLYGYARETTPGLRKFAQEATVYDRAIATEGFTLPAHASMFTGMYPSWHGATVTTTHRYGGPLVTGSRTLAGVLSANDYWTAEVVANYGYLGAPTGLTQGFELSDTSIGVHLSDSNRPFYLREGIRKVLSLGMDTAEFGAYRLRAADINGRAFAAIEHARNQKRPFFLFMNYMDAHVPYLPPPPFRHRFSESAAYRKPIVPEDLFLEVEEIKVGRRSLDENERSFLISQYDAGIAYMDSEIAKVLARLREASLYEDTLIIITADHGEAFGEHQRMEHSMGSVYENQVHVPLVVKYPRQHAGQRSAGLVSQVDFMPTVLELAGIPLLPGLQGQSLRAPRNEASGAVFSEGRARGERSRNPSLRGARRAMFSGSLKLITWSEGPPELYDISADPGELNNLYRADDPHQLALMARMTAWTVAIPHQDSRPAAPPDRSTVERLKSLGYAQ